MSEERKGLVDELHRPARRNFSRRTVRTDGIDDLWQADIVEMIPYASVNSGNKYLLTVIDTFSKYAFGVPMKTKTGNEVTAAMDQIFRRSGRTPNLIQVDQGSEFYNSKFEALMRERGIKLYSSFSVTKASIVERFNRTLKTRMWKQFSLRGSYKWLDLLDPLLKEYNEKSVHRTIGMRPADVTKAHTQTIRNRLQQRLLPPIKKPKLKRGDHVRISRFKSLFEKGYTPNWTTEVFRISSVRPTRPRTYHLEDLKGVPIKGGFYTGELQKTRYKDVYLVEKVLRRKKDKVLVRWLGFGPDFDEWIKAKDIL